jgi:hypothetical protein
MLYRCTCLYLYCVTSSCVVGDDPNQSSSPWWLVVRTVVFLLMMGKPSSKFLFLVVAVRNLYYRVTKLHDSPINWVAFSFSFFLSSLSSSRTTFLNDTLLLVFLVRFFWLSSRSTVPVYSFYLLYSSLLTALLLVVFLVRFFWLSSRLLVFHVFHYFLLLVFLVRFFWLSRVDYLSFSSFTVIN